MIIRCNIVGKWRCRMHEELPCDGPNILAADRQIKHIVDI